MTQEQQAVVAAPIDARQIILAGAGTGKTHVLVERIRHLLERGDLAGGYELLVLSFSRAVVRELKSRIASSGAGLVLPMTFDSFATRLLASLPSGTIPTDWRAGGYDARIAAADSALRTVPDARGAVQEYRHVFVDEIQDLVGVRASLVSSILDDCAGFTLLGDPAQAIYDHNLRSPADGMSSTEFLRQISQRYPDARVTLFEKNFRAMSNQAAAAEAVGSLLRTPVPDRVEIRQGIADLIRDLDNVGTCSDLATAIRGSTLRIAVLCRENASAMRVSQALFESGVDHRLQREATERVLPAWLAELFAGTNRAHWSRSSLSTLAAERASSSPTLPSSAELWEILSGAVRNDSLIDVDVLRDRCRAGDVPDDLLAQGDDVKVVVSTIHRCKGLEFDDVFLARPYTDVEDIDDPEELRVLYVGLSRARHDVWRFSPPPRAPWRKVPAFDDRWVRSSWNERWKTLGFEMRASDVSHLRPFGAGFVDSDPAGAQLYMSQHLHRGDLLQLAFSGLEGGGDRFPVYAVSHCDRLIGETTEAFGRSLRRRLSVGGQGPKRWPGHLSGTRTDGVETVVGVESEGAAAGLGGAGLWLRPRIVGLVDVQWFDPELEDGNGRSARLL